jgi:16S rRNA (guanine527-N7)-methyltransferase
MPAVAARRDVSAAPDALARFPFVTPAIRRDLESFVALLQAWQPTHNLVGASTLDNVWTRHIADSLQLLDCAPEFSEWVDLGSGAGFPALPIAIASKHAAQHSSPLPNPPPRGGREGVEPHFTLVEANAKKAAFLRAAIRETGANASVAAERIETHAKKLKGKADVVSARALAPLPKLLGLAYPYLHKDSVVLLLKGQDLVQETAAASKSWDFDVIDSPSATDAGGRVLAISRLRPKATMP